MAYDMPLLYVSLDTIILLLDAALLGFQPQGHAGETFLVMRVMYQSEVIQFIA